MRGALAVIADHPLLGGGLNNYKQPHPDLRQQW